MCGRKLQSFFLFVSHFSLKFTIVFISQMLTFNHFHRELNDGYSHSIKWSENTTFAKNVKTNSKVHSTHNKINANASLQSARMLAIEPISTILRCICIYTWAKMLTPWNGNMYSVFQSPTLNIFDPTIDDAVRYRQSHEVPSKLLSKKWYPSPTVDILRAYTHTHTPHTNERVEQNLLLAAQFINEV